MVVMNVIYSFSAYPFGKLSDGMSHTRLLQWGLVVLIAADVVLALSTHWIGIIVGVALWGMHMGMTRAAGRDGGQNAPAVCAVRRLVFFSLVAGSGLLMASVGAGAIWELWGAEYTFYAGAVICLLTLLYLRKTPAEVR